MRLMLPRFTLLRLVVALEMVAVVVWLWACRFAGLSDDQATLCVFLGCCFGLPTVGLIDLLRLEQFPIDCSS